MVFIKKIIKPVFFFKTETGSNRAVSVRFGYFRTKTGWFFRFGSVFPVLLGFFPVWLGFFLFGFGSVWFFQFQVYRTEPVGFLKILIGFFSRFGFSIFFFSIFPV
jgi:hypothetical protein